ARSAAPPLSTGTARPPWNCRAARSAGHATALSPPVGTPLLRSEPPRVQSVGAGRLLHGAHRGVEPAGRGAQVQLRVAGAAPLAGHRREQLPAGTAVVVDQVLRHPVAGGTLLQLVGEQRGG